MVVSQPLKGEQRSEHVPSGHRMVGCGQSPISPSHSSFAPTHTAFLSPTINNINYLLGKLRRQRGKCSQFIGSVTQAPFQQGKESIKQDSAEIHSIGFFTHFFGESLLLHKYGVSGLHLCHVIILLII